jgi:proteasome accessory factor B
LAVAGVHLGEPIGRDALLKLGAGGESIVRSEAAPLVDLRSIDGLPALSVLFDAVRQRAAVRFDYRGDERHVGVAGLRFRNGYWYAIGFDRDRGEARTFRVDRIATPPELGEPGSAELPAGFDVDSAFSRDPWQFGEGDPVEVDVLVDGAEAGRVITELGADAVVEQRDDGAVVARLSVTDTEAVVLWVLDLLDHAEVLAPDSVRQAVIDRLEAIAAHAADDGAIR